MLDHLVGTYEIVRRWDQPAWLQHAALVHSVYGTDVYHQPLLPVSRRCDVREMAGDGAERLAYLFCVTPREPLFAGVHLWARGLATPPLAGEPGTNDQPPASRAELDGLVLLHMANLAEQARAQDGSPGRWLVALRELAELLMASEAVTLPVFVAKLAAFSATDESLTRHEYRAGLTRADDPAVRANRLALAAAACPIVAEPCVWQAYLARSRGDVAVARRWAGMARERLVALGTAWDKRLSFDQWLELSRRLERSAASELSAAGGAITDPRTLFESVAALGHLAPVGESTVPSATECSPPRLDATFSEPAAMSPITAPDAAAGTSRFLRYVETVAQASPAGRAPYPDLESRPWYDPADFPLVRRLESDHAAIRGEILALEPSTFHRESERIKRSGDWEVAFLYERGRRRDEVCDACPATARAIESEPAMRTAAGLIYVSRMRAGTHIRAHRGPTNLRVRCHLGIKVPPGDCAIRVGDRTQGWREGRCLVFDDCFEHEAWNHTESDRIVLIVDLWHPGLSPTEVRWLEGLHTYAYAYARQLNRYWDANERAASSADVAGAPRRD